MYEITIENLNTGIKFWLEKKTRWPKDFHNELYTYLSKIKGTELTHEWCDAIVEILWSWVAIRPKTKQFIRERLKANLIELNTYYQKLNNCDTQLLTWSEVEPLFTTAKNLKGVTSPVFASKLCHFLLPSVYSVIDQEVLGGSKDYHKYWDYCQSKWKSLEYKEEFIAILKSKIGSNVITNYPWNIRIIELCFIGSRNKQR